MSRLKKSAKEASSKKQNARKRKRAAPARPVERLYADCAAAAPLSPRVKKRMSAFEGVFGNPGSLHKEGIEALRLLEEARKQVAEAIRAHTDEVIFTGGGTEADNLALLGALYPLLRSRGDIHAVVSAIEHPAVLEPLRHLKKYGLSLTVLPVDEEGRVSPRMVAEAIAPETALVSIGLANSEIGTIQPVREIGKFIRYARKIRAEGGNTLPLLYHTDAAQAPLYLPLAVDKLGIDLMALDASKIGGPQGSGCLYRRRGVLLEPILFGGGQESGLRPGTPNLAAALGLAEALVIAQSAPLARAQRMSRIRDALLEEILKLMPDTVVNGSLKERLANNLNISVPGFDGERATIALDARGVAVSTRSACEAAGERPSHVILALGAGARRAHEAVRITLGHQTSLKEARSIALALKEARALYGEQS